MRVVLFTGKGGVGKTTTAAATAVHVARHGRKTLVLSTDPAHSLGDALGYELGPEPVEVEGGLSAMQVDTQRRFERSWGDVQGYLRQVLALADVDPLTAEELTILPGAEEVLALLELRDQVASGLWDVVIVDCAPTAETLRLLALPDILDWYVERVFPTHRRMLRSLRPMLGRLGATPMPAAGVVDAVTRLHAELRDVRTLLSDRDTTSVRLVLTPESVVVAEARRTLTSLTLYGYRVDSVLANRLVPAGGDDPWRAGWVRAQAEQLEQIAASFPGLPLRTGSYRGSEPLGVDDLAEVAAELYADDDPLALPAVGDPVRVEREQSDEAIGGEDFVLVIALPHLDREEIDLARAGDELIVTAAGRRRMVALPSALRRCAVQSAGYADGALRVRFRPDPALWPRT